MDEFKKELQRGQKVRALQDSIIAFFVQHIQQINDIETLEEAKRKLEGDNKQ